MGSLFATNTRIHRYEPLLGIERLHTAECGGVPGEGLECHGSVARIVGLASARHLVAKVVDIDQLGHLGFPYLKKATR